MGLLKSLGIILRLSYLLPTIEFPTPRLGALAYGGKMKSWSRSPEELKHDFQGLEA
jgi:hypothetical protein